MSEKNWFENYPYLNDIFQHSDNLRVHPKTWGDLERWLNAIDKNIPTEDLKALLSWISPIDFVCKNNVKDILSKNKIIPKRDFDKLFGEIKEKKVDNEIESNKEKDLIPENYIKPVEDFLLSDSKFETIKEILDYYIVREDNNKLLIFVLLSGAYSNNYQIIIVVGDSSGGKSHMAERIIYLFPKKHTWTLTGASDKALIYKNWNSEKIIHIPEGQRNTEILENLKDLGDEGIFYNTVEKNEDNRFETREINIGKKSVITTTTIDQLNPQLENRAWKIEPDLSKEQSKFIIQNTLERKKDLIDKTERENKIKGKEKVLKFSVLALENEYKYDSIEMPFSDVLKDLLNYTFIKIRRDHKKFLALIEIITSWNYKIREYYVLNDKQILLSHPNDLIIAFGIGEEIFINLTGNLTPDKRKILECFENMPVKETKREKQTKIIEEAKEERSWIKTNEIYDFFCKKLDYKKSLKSFRNLLNSLSEDGYLEKEKKGRDNEYKFREGASFKILDELKKKEIYIKSFEEYNHRKEILRSMEDIKFYPKEINPINKDLFNINIYNRIIEIFNENKKDNLLIDNIVQVLSIDFPENQVREEIYNMVKLQVFTKDYEDNLIYEKEKRKPIKNKK